MWLSVRSDVLLPSFVFLEPSSRSVSYQGMHSNDVLALFCSRVTFTYATSLTS